MRLIIFAVTLMCSLSQHLFSKELSLCRNELTFGPQSVYLKRVKTGAKQNGHLTGVQLTYDRLKRYGWYLGGDFGFAKGKLKGTSSMGGKLHSKFSEGYGEGLFGYTLQQKNCLQLALTPFIGGGYLIQKNHFVLPSPLPIHFKTHFAYGILGLRLGTNLWNGLDLALIAKVKLPFEPSCKVSNDPENESVTQKIGERLLYRVDLPLTYQLFCDGRANLQLRPFFALQNFGKRINMPFNFYKTKLTFWGATLSLDLRF